MQYSSCSCITYKNEYGRHGQSNDFNCLYRQHQIYLLHVNSHRPVVDGKCRYIRFLHKTVPEQQGEHGKDEGDDDRTPLYDERRPFLPLMRWSTTKWFWFQCSMQGRGAVASTSTVSLPHAVCSPSSSAALLMPSIDTPSEVVGHSSESSSMENCRPKCAHTMRRQATPHCMASYWR